MKLNKRYDILFLQDLLLKVCKFQHSRENDEFFLSDQSHQLGIKLIISGTIFSQSPGNEIMNNTNYQMPICVS
jgi:hypothetical protein